MATSARLNLLLVSAALAGLAGAGPGLAQTKDHAPVALGSSAKMSQDRVDSESWTYMKSGLDVSKVQSVIVEATDVYKGPDAQFDGIAQADRARFAEIVTNALRTEIGKAFPSTGAPPAQTLKIKVTLLGATPTKTGLATATRVTTVGFAMSALKSVRGKPGSLTGSLLYAVEVRDAANNEVLVAAVRRRNPDALDIPATLSTTDTVKAVARDFAKSVRERLESAVGR